MFISLRTTLGFDFNIFIKIFLQMLEGQKQYSAIDHINKFLCSSEVFKKTAQLISSFKNWAALIRQMLYNSNTSWHWHSWVLRVTSVVPDSAPLWTVACQDPLSMGILQTRTLEWVAMPSSRGSSQPRDWTQVSCVSWIASGFFTADRQPQKPVMVNTH